MDFNWFDLSLTIFPSKKIRSITWQLTLMTLGCLVTSPYFSAIFTKGSNLCDFLCASMVDEALLNGVFSYREEFAPK